MNIININEYFLKTNLFQNANTIAYNFYDNNSLIVLSFCLFSIGLVGIIVNIRNVIISMLCLELMFVSTIFGFIVNSLTYTDLNEG
jgi:hypothetical protein